MSFPPGSHRSPGNAGRHSVTVWRRPAVGTAFLLAGAWAFLPLGPTSVPVPKIEEPARVEVASVPLDEAAFRLPLWVAPPPPPPPPDAPEKELNPLPFKLQLLAIVPEGDRWKALFYDPDKDKIVSAREGEWLAGATLDRIVPTGRDAGVVVTDNKSRPRTLVLREPAPVLPDRNRGAAR